MLSLAVVASVRGAAPALATSSIPVMGSNWTAYWLHDAVKPPQNARCLDGSPPLYYFSPGSGDGKDKWEIHMEGGAWCSNAKECVNWWGFRSSLVDAKILAPDKNDVLGYFNRTLQENPMKNWNYIFIRYCDGFSFAGNVDNPQTVPVTNKTTNITKNVQVHVRGRAILDAVIDDLLTTRGMRSATNVVVGGCSAGGMAVYLNCDHWAEKVAAANANTNVVCLADAGWFPLIPDQNGRPSFDGVVFPSAWFNGIWKSGFDGHNLSLSLHPDCLADRNASNAWQCTMPQTAAQYVKTPLFAFNSKYDAFQIPNMMQSCFGNATDRYGPCSTAQVPWFSSRHGVPCSRRKVDPTSSRISACAPGLFSVKTWLATARAKASGHAAFLSACYFHCGSHPTFGVVKGGKNGDGVTAAEAFSKWMVKPTRTLWDTDKPWNFTKGCGRDNTPGPEKQGVKKEERTSTNHRWLPKEWHLGF